MSWWKRKPNGNQIVDAQPAGPLVTSMQVEGTEERATVMTDPHFPIQSAKGSDSIAEHDGYSESKGKELGNFFAHGEDLLAFNLNWQLLKEGQLQKLRLQALADGYTHQVVSVESDLLGVLKLPRNAQDSRNIYPAALLLAEAVSLGGDEVFVFRLEGSRYAMVALKNSMPVPGFDLIGNAQVISEAAQSYLGLPHKNEVRLCGDAEILSGAEFFDFSSALVSLDRSVPRIKRIPDFRALFFRGAIAFGGVLVLVVGWVGWSYFEAKAEAERLQRETDPNLLYERSYSNSAPSIKALGTSGLKAMIVTLTRIPLEVGGWGFSGAVCHHAECTVTWNRQAGNYADFDEGLPDDVKQSPEYGFIGADSKTVQLKTRHEVKIPESGELNRENLPLIAHVQADFVSRLQDYSLIDAKVQVSAPSPFPSGTADIGPIFKPVLVGSWSMDLPLWTMDSLTVPDYVLVETLSLDLPMKVDDGKTAWNYKLTGKYYAKGKNF
jgi:Pilin accessory protein (PilO)